MTVDNAPPTVALTNPANGAAVTGVVNLAVDALDDVGVQKVQYYRDSNVLLGTSLSAPFSFSWDSTTVTTGTHTLYAVATDTVGNTATSTTISVTVDRTLPTVSMTAPSNGALVSGTAVPLSATASDNVGISQVDFYRDSNVLLGTDNTSPYGIDWDSTSTTQWRAYDLCRCDRYSRQYQDVGCRQRHSRQHRTNGVDERTRERRFRYRDVDGFCNCDR